MPSGRNKLAARTTAASVAHHRAVERWFLDRGVPAVLTQRGRLQAVWSRSAPFLAFGATGETCSAATYQLTGRYDIVHAPVAVQHIGLAVGLLVVPVAAGVGWIVARMVSDHAQAMVSAVAAAIGIAAGAVKGHTFEEHLAYLVMGICAVALSLLLTATGLGSVFGWAARLTLSQLVAAWALLIRALPVVLLSVLVFFNTGAWAMAATLSARRFWLAMVIFFLIAAAFVVQGTLEHARPTLMMTRASFHHSQQLIGTPFEHMPDAVEARPLTRGERFNVIFLLAVSQLARILTVAFVTGMLFFVVGLVLMTPELLRAWSQHDPTYGILLGFPLPVPLALLHMTAFLGALTFMYVSARAVGAGEYRYEFLDPLIEDMEVTLLARNRYFCSRATTYDDVRPGDAAQASAPAQPESAGGA